MRSVTLTISGSQAQVFTLANTATAEETRALIQQALDLAANASSGGKVELSEGLFTVAPGNTAGDGALRVGSNTEFAGAGMGLTQIKLTDNPGHDVTGIVRTASGKTQSDGTPASTHDVVIRDMTIDGNKANSGTALVDGFFCGPKPFTELSIDTNIRLDRVEVCNVSRYGFDPHERTDNLTFANCVSHDNTFDGFTIDYCSNVTLIDCEAYNNGRHGVNVVTGSYGVTIQNLNSHNNGSTGVTLQTGNLEIRDLTNDVKIIGGTITANGGDGIVVREVENVTIGGTADGESVYVADNGRYGILLEGVKGASIVGNTIENNTAGTGTDDAEIRVRGYLQTHLDSDPLNDMFEISANITLSKNTIGSATGIVHSYGVSYSDTTNFTLANDNTIVFLAMPTVADVSKVGAVSTTVPVVTSGNDVITGTEGGDSITGGSGDDQIFGLGGKDKLYGADGNDTLDGGAGSDTLTGGFGNDIYWADGSDTIVEASKAGMDEVKTLSASLSIAGFANVERLTFEGTGGFKGTGNSAANTISGGSGNNELDGGAGNDTLIGGTGNDTYTIDNAADVIEDTGGIDTVRAAYSVVLANGLENLVLTLAGLTGTGNGAANLITGTSGHDVIYGLGGNDKLDGGAGADHLHGGDGNDTFIIDDASDVITDTSGIDLVISSISRMLGNGLENITLTGTANTTAQGNAANNVLTGNAGANLIQGFGGNDVLNGGLGRDTLSGGDGNDSYYIERSDELAYDTAGIDRVIASASYELGTGLDHLVLAGTNALNGKGNALANSIVGNGAANIISGMAGNDILNGNAGNDTISGGTGRDVLTGGSGFDRFVFDTAPSTLYNSDRITDFSTVYDTIALSRAAFAALKIAGPLSSANFVRGTGALDANDHIIYNPTNGAVIYDSNGNVAGGNVIVTYLTTGLAVTAADFLVL